MSARVWCSATFGTPSLQIAPIEEREESLNIHHLQSLAWWSCWSHAGFLLMLPGTSPKLHLRRSCSGASPPELSPDGSPHQCYGCYILDQARVSPSGRRLCCRCMSSACQLVSHLATPRERQAGSVTEFVAARKREEARQLARQRSAQVAAPWPQLELLQVHVCCDSYSCHNSSCTSPLKASCMQANRLLAWQQTRPLPTWV
jgi:hypothetical protein